MNEDAPRLLIVEDDDRFAETITAEFLDRGYSVSRAASLEELDALDTTGIGYAVIDLRLRSDSGLDAVNKIKQHSPHARIVMLTGYGSIATAVQSTKLGATQYLTKPIEIDDLERALLADDYEATEIPEQFQSLDRHEREYIEWVLAQCEGNISQAARRLGLHRQSLQRKLRKFTPSS